MWSAVAIHRQPCAYLLHAGWHMDPTGREREKNVILFFFGRLYKVNSSWLFLVLFLATGWFRIACSDKQGEEGEWRWWSNVRRGHRSTYYNRFPEKGNKLEENSECLKIKLLLIKNPFFTFTIKHASKMLVTSFGNEKVIHKVPRSAQSQLKEMLHTISYALHSGGWGKTNGTTALGDCMRDLQEQCLE